MAVKSGAPAMFGITTVGYPEYALSNLQARFINNNHTIIIHLAKDAWCMSNGMGNHGLLHALHNTLSFQREATVTDYCAAGASNTSNTY